MFPSFEFFVFFFSLDRNHFRSFPENKALFPLLSPHNYLPSISRALAVAAVNYSRECPNTLIAVVHSIHKKVHISGREINRKQINTLKNIKEQAKNLSAALMR